MKNQCIKTFKQIYKDKETLEEKEFFYKVSIVKDTEDYKYRIINLDSMSIWKGWKFDTYNEAKNFLIKHPNCIKEVIYE